jgi:hypothetical protein
MLCMTVFQSSTDICRRYIHYTDQGEGREGVETAIHRASQSVMQASRGVRRSNCKQIWLRVHDPSKGMLKLAIAL